MRRFYEEYKAELIESIPILEGMGIEIYEIQDHSVTLSAPLSKNNNYQGTAFGGSLNTICILSSYLLIHHILKSNKVPFKTLVIQDSSIRYLRPVDSDFAATAEVDANDTNEFLEAVKSKNKGRISVKANVMGKVEFEGRFVVFN